jgi:hypothetical protein
MNCQPKTFTVEEIVDAWNNSSLKANPEYQRGLAWKAHQQQALIDSIFRQYPIPPLFLHEVAAKGLGGHKSVRYDVVDGQQRIRSLADFLGDKYQLLNADDKKLRLPNSLRSTPAPWGKRRFSELDAALQDQLTKRKLDVFVITGVMHEDEIRDLFIRLQSGTALSRQQIRDAWPGNVGPYIERLAGKMDRTPAIDFSKFADKRGERSDDERDPYMADRQFCVQLLSLFLSRQSDPFSAPSIGANELDKLYHENTEFDPAGESAKRFESALKHTTKVCNMALELEVEGPRGRKKKFTKLNLISTFLFIQDLSNNPLLKINHQFYEQVAPHLCAPQLVNSLARATSGPKIAEHYRLWREIVDGAIGIRIDPQRVFDEEQKRQIFERAEGRCAVCGELVDTGDDEYDHFPIAHRDGGKTVVENGRLVHRHHHPRGRPLAEEDE